ncbi:hypothetical protein MUP95_09790 [bacterium]|nr:hypothetical protein [bacterium]
MNYKNWIYQIIFFGVIGSVHAQGMKILELQGGYLNPKGTEAGFICGGCYGFSFDERIDMSLGLSYFHKGYTKKSEIASEVVNGIVVNTVEKTLEYSTTLLPISVNLNIHFPSYSLLNWFFGGSASYQLLFNTENNYEEQIKEKRTYRAFGWMIRGGTEFRIGTLSSFFLEALYNICKTKRNEEKVEGLPIWEEVDVSGLGFRAGVRLEFF